MIVATDGEARLFGDPLAAADLSFARGNIGVGGGAVCCEGVFAVAMGDIVRAGFPVEDPMLDMLACLWGPVVGGGKGPRPSIDAGFVAAATADAYLSSVGGRVACVEGLGTPFCTGNGGAVAAVEVTIGRLVATLGRRADGIGSFALDIGSSFCGVGGWSSVTDCASRDD